MKAIIAASIAAVLVQPVVFAFPAAVSIVIGLLEGAITTARDLRGLWSLASLSVYVLVVAAIFVAFLGIPLFLGLRRINKLSWRSILSAGFLAAAVPYAIIAFPLWQDYSSGSSFGGNWYGKDVEFIANGVYTIYGWLSYVEGTIGFGINGLAGADVFYLVWLRLHEPQKTLPADGLTPRR